MGRRKMNLTPEEEIEHKRRRRENNAEAARRYRAKRKNQKALTTDTNLLHDMNSNGNTSHSSNVLLGNSTLQSPSTANGIFNVNLPIVINTVTENISSSFTNTRSISEHYIGKMDVYCCHCNAKHFNAEKVANKGMSFNDCCHHGEVKLDPLPDFPAFLKSLFENTHPKSNNFFQYAQEALEIRLKNNIECDSEILKELDTFMRQNNVFADSYQMMAKELNKQCSNSNNSNDDPELHLMFTLKPGVDKRRFNFQRENEVAVIFSTTADGEIPESYVSVINKNTKSYITQNDYHKYRIAIRNEFNVFLMGRRLFQQWVVDSYVKTEKDRLNYLRNNQKQLRAESYQGLIDHLNKCRNSENNDNTTNIGKMIILPSLFSGSPRNMLQHYQDSIAIVRKFGKPDIFVTMTCNPNWLEIKENLFSKQTAADRPDIVTRVFNIKKNALIDMIVKERHFGEVLAYVYVIEFQKRGLPHMHMLITLAEKYKITTPQMVDKYICAEIPNESDDPILYDIITKNMLHGPCGNWCIVNGKCSKHYPKKFQQETTMDENCYPYYRRRDLGIIFTRSQGSHFTNEHVVPYNRILSKRFNSHINVEIISSIKSVKYLYKYVYKGHDKALITINGNVSNSDNNAIFRPAEAVWRILSKPLQEKSHSIIRLPIHLPNQQNLLINNDCDEAEIRNVLEKQTMLIDFFVLNARDQNARKYIYTDIPYHYVFKKENRSNTFHWVQRQKQFKVISRMYSVSPSQVELFHLRLLLTKVKGPKSYEDIRTVNGHTYDTYMNTCLALGLIEDDNEWERALGEAESWMMPYQLRYLFVRILLHCYPMYPDKLWEKFKKSMSEDYTINLGSILGEKKAYFHINSILCDEGSHISNFPNMPQMTDWEYVDDNGTIQENNHRGAQQYQTLNEQQKEISKNRNICTMAYTGIAATLLPNGKTLHKTFNLPVPLFSDSSSNIK
ncbi:uncharacterized protein [Chelonus insularis]|uniref:uncharacterized protein n=1 Tax=Chelonus insularis TaxID=460826 RepID=UPI0015893D42|nr:uncharacterized protein LOC118070600 [Chelonus insularis]